MGRTYADGFAECVEEGAITLSTALSVHLSSNHYPPLPQALCSVAEQAIAWAKRAVEEDDESYYTNLIPMPEGISFRGLDVISVADAIECMHLESFI